MLLNLGLHTHTKITDPDTQFRSVPEKKIRLKVDREPDHKLFTIFFLQIQNCQIRTYKLNLRRGEKIGSGSTVYKKKHIGNTGCSGVEVKQANLF